MSDNGIKRAVEIRGLYDGPSVYVMNDGSIVNRWRGTKSHRERATDEYCREQGWTPEP